MQLMTRYKQSGKIIKKQITSNQRARRLNIMARAKKKDTTPKEIEIVPVDIELEYKLGKAKADSYIQKNYKKIDDIIVKTATEMYTLTGEIDATKLINGNLLDTNLLSLYDIETNELLEYNFNDVKQGSDYWEQKTDE